MDSNHVRPYIYLVNSPDVSCQACLPSRLDRGPSNWVCLLMFELVRCTDSHVINVLRLPLCVLWLFNDLCFTECVYYVSHHHHQSLNSLLSSLHIHIQDCVREDGEWKKKVQYKFCNLNHLIASDIFVGWWKVNERVVCVFDKESGSWHWQPESYQM